MSVAARVQAVLERPFMAAVFFLSGVTYDGLTLTRIDRLTDNLILLFYLLVLGILIVIAARMELRPPLEANAGQQLQFLHPSDRFRPYYRRAIQFLLGGLFSAYAIFYFRSVSLTTTSIFFVLLLILLVGNEFLHDRLTNVRLLLSLFGLVSLSFFTFVLPVVTGMMNTGMFLLGAGLSITLILVQVRLIYAGAHGVTWHKSVLAGLPALVLVGLMIGLYFLNWIPPVPLSLRFGGVFHQVNRQVDSYELVYERGPWYRFWQRSDDPFRGAGPIYCFTAVFAPVDLRTTIYHRWQIETNEAKGGTTYATTDRIGFRIAGGRDEGYRGVTIKQQVVPGNWRVDVETADGRILGRVKFRVEPAPEFDDPPLLTTIVY